MKPVLLALMAGLTLAGCADYYDGYGSPYYSGGDYGRSYYDRGGYYGRYDRGPYRYGPRSYSRPYYDYGAPYDVQPYRPAYPTPY